MAIPTSFQVGAKKTPDAAAAKYATRAGAAGTDWAEGYLMPKRDPFDAAAAAAGHWLARINETGTTAFAAGLGRVDKAAVAKLVHDQGATLYAQGVVNKGVAKIRRAFAGLIPDMQAHAAALAPRGTLEQNIARGNDQSRYNASLRGKYRG